MLKNSENPTAPRNLMQSEFEHKPKENNEPSNMLALIGIDENDEADTTPGTLVKYNHEPLYSHRKHRAC